VHKVLKNTCLISAFVFSIGCSLTHAESANSDLGKDGKSNDFVKIGGAARFNYEYKSYESNSSALDFELFRIKVEGRVSDIEFYAQYRWYEDFNFPEYAYLGYDIDTNNRIEFGLNRVPFGLQPFSSHGYWESLLYHIGLDDDNDVGAKYIYNNNGFELIAAFYQNAELSKGQENRFSFDLVTRQDDIATADINEREANYEKNQWNLRIEKKFGNLSLGASAQYGDIFNEDTSRSGSQDIKAIHASYNYHKWNYQIEIGTYDFDTKNSDDVSSDQVLFGAFGTRFHVASNADFLLLNIERKIDTSSIGFIDELSCYNNWGIISPKRDSENVGNDTTQNLLGCSIKKGPLLIFSELISGNNSFFVNGPGVGLNGSTSLDHRVNINIGFYF
jgi:hypothetical protein